MFSKKLAALVAASLVVATSPVAAQSTVRAAQSLPAASVENRAGAELDAENQLMGGGIWAALLGVALLAALVLVVVEDNNVDLPSSP